MIGSLGERLRLRLKQLEEIKNDYEGMQYDIARYVNPRRELLKDSQRFDDKGRARGKSVYSGVPNSALGVWADGMQGHMVSQSLRWFKSVIGNSELNKIDEVQQYLQEYDEAMYGEFNRSNFYAILGEWFRDAGSVGTATLYTEEDIGNNCAVHTPIHLREIFIAENKYGDVDTVFRKFFLTAKQAVDKFGTERLNRNIIKNAEEHPEKRHEFVHAVFPNKDRMYGSMLAKHKPIASVYLQMDGNQEIEDGYVVKKSGYDLNPYAVWRLRKNSDEIYGYSPAADALVEIKQINQMAKTLLQAAHMSVSPPMNVPEHMRGNVRLTPNGHNYYERGGDKMSAVHTGVNYPIGIDREKEIQRIIEDKYRVEFFLVLARSEREMTATEIMERQAEKSVLLGPQVDRMEREGLIKTFDIVSEIADQAGRLPEPPQVLIDSIEQATAMGQTPARIDIRFMGPLAQAQRRLFQMQPIKNGINELAQAAVVFPEVLDVVDKDKLGERILDATDFPQNLILSDEKVQAIREQRAQQIAQQQAQQQAQGIAEGYKNTTKAPEEGSGAEAIIDALGG
ncbi:MAG: head-tail connector protein [Deltaproteobacteria bacterium]|nr:head-tail connector protein [Deltaproteobacteria bacterium]